MDFINIYTTMAKNDSKNRESGSLLINVDFRVFNSKDLMVRGKTFYAVYDDQKKLWVKDEMHIVRVVDREILKRVKELEDEGQTVSYKLMESYDSGLWQKYVSYVKNMPDNWTPLDTSIHFLNDELDRESYATKVLPYARRSGSIQNYDKLIGTLYTPEERDKLEWAVGAVLTGESQHIQKFITLYGASGSGKSTFLNILQKLVRGYYISFNAKDLVGRDAFGMEVFKSNPLVAIQHDGDLSKIEDNSTLNSMISHEEIVMNEKHKSKYTIILNCFLFLGTNKPVSITDSKSGLLRRLIDVKPSGDRVSQIQYLKLMSDIDYELGAIADYCITRYESMGPHYYDKYTPQAMIFETNTVYNFMFDNALIFTKEKEVQLKQLYDMYLAYCSDSGEQYPLKKRVLRAEAMSYFEEFHNVTRLEDGRQARSVYKNFKRDIFVSLEEEATPTAKDLAWIIFEDGPSKFNDTYSDLPAQYANDAGVPSRKWENCKTKLKDLDPGEIHYVAGLPINHIVIDFDIKDENGEKSLEKNLDAANKWPETYAELSKSGQGIHLHYIWNGGTPENLERIFSPNVEIKVFTGNSSLRRKLTKHNNKDIAILHEGLKFSEKKGDTDVINKKNVEDERHLRVMIKKCMNKEFHGSTKPEIDFIFKLLQDAYDGGLVYDVTDMRSAVLAFAASSSNQAGYCIELVPKMKWASEQQSVPVIQESYVSEDIVFYDVEVFKNLFLIVYKIRGKGKKKVAMINPTPQEVGAIFNFKLVGFNNKRYDDHMLYAAYLGYSTEQIYDLSQKMISKAGSVRNGFREAYSLAYTDVYDFSTKKQSLKKWELELGIKHNELDLDFNEPAPEELWPKIIEYCGDDVDATEQVFEARQADWIAREILADIADGTVNMTTNQLTTKIVFGNERNPKLEYTNLEETFPGYSFVQGSDNKWRNMYRGVDLGMGGYVYAEPGMYFDVDVLDIQSMHPTSIIAMNYFGKYTKRYSDLKDARVAIKNGDLASAKNMFDAWH